MLQSWVLVQDFISRPQPKPDHAQQETVEHREHRLRSEYERTLTLQRDSDKSAAKSAFQNLLNQLTPHPVSAPSTVTNASRPFARPVKRPRTQTNELPQWERLLRYATNRNLGETHLALDEHLQALNAFSRALDDDPSDFLVWLRAGRAAATCGHLHVARRAFEHALSMRPRHWLVTHSYYTLLTAIGDVDDDVYCREPCDESERIIKARVTALENEYASQPAPSQPEVLPLSELSWSNLVEALRLCLLCRLSGRSSILVAHPVRFSMPDAPNAPPDQSSASSDEVVVVGEMRPLNRRLDDDIDLVEVTEVTPTSNARSHPSSSAQPAAQFDLPRPSTTPPPGTAVASTSPLVTGIFQVSSAQVLEQPSNPTAEVQAKKPTESATDNKKPELRRSSRRTNANEFERRTTRTNAEASRSQREDAEMIQALLAACRDKGRHSITNTDRPSTANALSNGTARQQEKPTGADAMEDADRPRSSPWKNIIAETDEALAVHRFVHSFEGSNSGPADLLLRILSELAKIKVAQYFSTLALLWLTVRDKLNLNTPDYSEVTVLIVEALLVSGKKAAKQKARRFQEAGRLLSQIRLSDLSGDDHLLLCIRIAWLWSMLHDCRGEMQLSFQSAERTLVLLKSVERREGVIPAAAGPELSGYTWDTLENIVQGRISQLKSARDLEKAEEELSKVGSGDTEAAKRTVTILAPSVCASIKALELDKWHVNDLKYEFTNRQELEEWEARLDGEIDLEPQLKVLCDACVRACDVIGELVCFSVRLRMAVHYYAAKVRSENETGTQEKEKDNDSSSIRIADLLMQIRKYVLLIKKICSAPNAQFLSGKPGPSGWTMEQAASIAGTTIVSLTELIIATIPLAKNSSSSTEMGASQKNRRLGFTRCMLAFPRCILLQHRCLPQSGEKSVEEFITKKMLYVSFLCLKALVGRGCCREEGTSGALIKLYQKFLCTRLEEISTKAHAQEQERRKLHGARDPGHEQNIGSTHEHKENEKEDEDMNDSNSDSSMPKDNNHVNKADPNYEWSDAGIIRGELAQCFECLFQVQELKAVSGDDITSDDVPWLDAACRVSKHIGLSFVGSDLPGMPGTMDSDVCRIIYFFYRKLIFEAMCLRRRDGRRVKRLRGFLTQLSEALPEDAPHGVCMLSFQSLDTIVSDVVDSNTDISMEAAENVSKLEKEWNLVVESNKKVDLSVSQLTRNVQLSYMYFEVFSLDAMSILDAYDAEYKKQRNAERRKRPKDIADRLLTASSECLIALRCRPWSVGAWILLGRIFVEISDLALDERELCISSFGLYRTEDIASLGDGDSIETNFGRAEACFGFAESLLQHSWAKKASSKRIPIESSRVLGFAYDGIDDEAWDGFGDDGDLFASFGLTNETTSRPVLDGEDHPMELETAPDSHRMAAIRLGSAALNMLRLREKRYFHLHWTLCSLDVKIQANPGSQYPTEVVKLASKTLNLLRDGLRLHGENALSSNEQNGVEAMDIEGASKVAVRKSDPEWRTGYCFMERMRWYYTVMEAKLLRKSGHSHQEYLPVFERALEENRVLRDAMKQPRDIEPLYKLHSSRMKLLRMVENNADAVNLLTTLERYSYRTQAPIVIDDVNDDEDWVTVRRNAVAEDILSAMQACTDLRGEANVLFAEFFFKSTYCKAVLLAEILKDVRGATSELGRLFRVDAAARVLDQGPDGVHRGYLYKLWNYRYTETGVEPALETERKLIRWRSKLLGLYGQLLQHNGEWRLIAGILLRLKRRLAEDLPVDGAIVDDLIEAYAVTRRMTIISSMEKGILTDAAAFETSFRTTWDIYIETLRLSQGAKRVRLTVVHEEQGGTGEEQLVLSGRPRCLASILSVLRIEHVRWMAAIEGRNVDVSMLNTLPAAVPMSQVAADVKRGFVATMQASASKWPLDDKLTRPLMRRIGEYGGGDVSMSMSAVWAGAGAGAGTGGAGAGTGACGAGVGAGVDAGVDAVVGAGAGVGVGVGVGGGAVVGGGGGGAAGGGAAAVRVQGGGDGGGEGGGAVQSDRRGTHGASGGTNGGGHGSEAPVQVHTGPVGPQPPINPQIGSQVAPADAAIDMS